MSCHDLSRTTETGAENEKERQKEKQPKLQRGQRLVICWSDGHNERKVASDPDQGHLLCSAALLLSYNLTRNP